MVRLRRCSRSSHPAKRSHGRCANQSNTCLSSACAPPHPPPTQPPPLPNHHHHHHPRLLSWWRAVGAVPKVDASPSVLIYWLRNKLRGITGGSSSQMDRQGQVLICSSIIFFYLYWKLLVPRGITQSDKGTKISRSQCWFKGPPNIM